MFSARLPPHVEINALSRRLEDLRASGTSIVDLTQSNPTKAGVAYPVDLLSPLGDRRALRYDPHPCGMRSARAAIAEDYARRGRGVDPAHVVLCASTSEAYSWLFKLLCDPGENVLIPRPSYPLFEHLTRLESVGTMPYDLRFHGRWEIDCAMVASAAPAARALLLVSPNNPTGSFVSRRELQELSALAREHDLALILDEVFADYAVEWNGAPTAPADDVLSFTLGGASKLLGLPQIKLGWIVVDGPDVARAAAVQALELIADTFLSVSTPVQVAAPDLLRRAALVRHAIHTRVRDNLKRAREIVRRYPACEVLPVEGGWTAVVRVPATRSEETLVLDLLQRERILVHPGYFFDFPHEAFMIVSLLPPEDVFSEAFERALNYAVQ